MDARNAVGLVLMSVALMSARGAEEEKEPVPPEFRRIEALPAVREAAKAAGFALEGVAPLALERTKMAPGDAVTVLVSLSKGSEVKQWVVEVAASELDEKGKKRRASVVRLFSNTGREYRFGSEPAGMAIRIIGPLEASDAGRKKATAPEVKRGRATVSADYLGLGLERVPASMLRVRALRAANPALPPGALLLGPRPFPPEVVAEARKIADAVDVAEAEERATAGSFLALMEFFQIAASTPGLDDVLSSVIDVPWWSIVRSGGKMPAINFEGLRSSRKLEVAEWGAVAGRGVSGGEGGTSSAMNEVYAFPMQLRLNGQPALLFQMAVVAPRPPLLMSAGIIGLVATRPDGKGPVLMLRVVATRVAGRRS